MTADVTTGETIIYRLLNGLLRFPKVETVCLSLCIACYPAMIAAEGTKTQPLPDPIESQDDYQSRLWRIEGSNNNPDLPVSWLFGTLHVEDTDVLALFDPVQTLLDQTERLVIEVDTSDLTRQEYESHLRLPIDGSLRDIIGDSLFERTIDAIAETGMSETELDRYRPFAPIFILVSPQRKTGLYLDEKIRRIAIARNKEITGLETLEEQMQILGGLSNADQISLLSYAIDSKDALQDDIKALIEEYKNGELGKLLELSRRQMNPPDKLLARRVERRLLSDRNKIMTERLVPLLEEKSNFIAVGAAHLPAADGIIELLRSKGYWLVPQPEL